MPFQFLTFPVHFSPQRACSMAKLNHGASPEELVVKEAYVTKGLQRKRARIMGRGRTGVGYKRATHVVIRVEKVDFDREIGDAVNPLQQRNWRTLKTKVAKLLEARRQGKLVYEKSNIVYPA